MLCYNDTATAISAMIKPHHHRDCVDKALKNAQQICTQKNLKLTPIRARVLELIWQSHKPIKAYDLLAKLSDSNHIEKPPTVYRALEFLMSHKFIHRIESCNAYIGCEYGEEHHDSQFFICDQCEQVKEVREPKLNQTLLETSEKQGFIPYQTSIEIHGTCAKCAK